MRVRNTCAQWVIGFSLLIFCFRAGAGEGEPDRQFDGNFGREWVAVTMFSSDPVVAYRVEALGLILDEANQVARELKLPETLPITVTNLVEKFISPPSFAKDAKCIGTVTTRNFHYSVARGNKLCYVEVTHREARCTKWAKDYVWPLERFDTNAAYQLATQWMAKASMDVEGLNRDYHLMVTTDEHFVGIPPGKFIPVYVVGWYKEYEPIRGLVFASETPKWEPVAEVQLFAPTKTLLGLRVEDPKYISRQPLRLLNLDAAVLKGP